MNGANYIKLLILLAFIIGFSVSCSKMKVDPSLLNGGQNIHEQNVIFCANNTAYHFTKASFLSNSLTVVGAVATGQSCVPPIIPQSNIIYLWSNYTICVNEEEFVPTSNTIGYVTGLLYVPSMVSTGKVCGGIFKNGFD